MSLTSNCKTDTTATFTGQIGNNRVLFQVDHLILIERFRLTAKSELPKVMLGAKLQNYKFYMTLLNKIMSTRSKKKNSKIKKIKDFYNIELTR